MSTNIKALLATAAEMRAVGHPWEAVARKVHRTAKTCRNWPVKFKADWEALYRAVEERRFEETSKEAHSYLINLLRHEDPKVKLKAEEIWHKYGCGAYGRAGSMVLPPAEPGPAGKNDALVREFAALVNIFRGQIDRRRAHAGKPPATDDEFIEEWARETWQAERRQWEQEREDQDPARRAPEQQHPNPPAPPPPPAPANGAGNPVIVFGVLLLAAAFVWQRPAPVPGPEYVRAVSTEAAGREVRV